MRARAGPRLGRIGCLLTLAGAIAWCSGPAAAQDEPGGSSTRAATSGTWTVTTVPPTPGVRVSANGRTGITGRDGSTSLPIRAGALFDEQVHVATTRVGGRARATLARWFPRPSRRTLVATLRMDYRVRLRFVDRQGEPVPASQLGSATLKASHGRILDLRGAELTRPFWLQGSRVVPFAGGKLFSKPVFYRLLSVRTRGTDVVNRGQQKFEPASDPLLEAGLLYYSARFRAHDALLGSRIGTGIRLRFPDGRWQRYPFDEDGDVTITKLPRGTYTVRVDGPGLSFSRPVSVSRDQDVALPVLSYADLGLAGGAMALVAGGLLVAGRPHLIGLRRRRPVGPPAGEGEP